MTSLKKTIFFLIGVIVVLNILRETGILNFNYYNSSMTSTTSTVSWTGGSMSVTNSLSAPKPKQSYKDISIIILQEKDTLYKEIHKLAPVIITIETFSTGPLWTPFYKSVDFSVVGIPGFEHGPKDNTSASANVVLQSNISGTLAITGNITITGFCSRREATRLVKNLVVNSFVESTKKYLSTEPGFADTLPLYKM